MDLMDHSGPCKENTSITAESSTGWYCPTHFSKLSSPLQSHCHHLRDFLHYSSLRRAFQTNRFKASAVGLRCQQCLSSPGHSHAQRELTATRAEHQVDVHVTEVTSVWGKRKAYIFSAKYNPRIVAILSIFKSGELWPQVLKCYLIIIKYCPNQTYLSWVFLSP